MILTIQSSDDIAFKVMPPVFLPVLVPWEFLRQEFFTISDRLRSCLLLHLPTNFFSSSGFDVLLF